MAKINFTVLVSLFLFACNSNKKTVHNQNQILHIHAFKFPCSGVAKQQCFLVKENEADNWDFWYDGIKGFDFEPGYSYILEVDKVELSPENLPADASSIQYNLKSIKEKKAFGIDELSGEWKLTHINSEPLIIKGRKKPTLVFDIKNKKVNGNDGCNQLFGSIELTEGAFLQIGPLASTRMACPGFEYDRIIGRILNASTTYGYFQNTLVLQTNDDETLTYNRMVDNE